MTKAKKIEIKTKSKPQRKLWLTLFIFLFLVFMIVLIFLPTKKITCYETKTETYTDTERYKDTEQYLDTEYSTKYLKYRIILDDSNSWCVEERCNREEQYCVEKNFWGNCIRYKTRCISKSCIKKKVTCDWKIKNNDDQNGRWSIEMIIDADRNYDKTENVWVGAGDSSYFVHNAVIDYGESFTCKYKVIKKPSKSISEKVIKEKVVWKTRPITKTREVKKPYAKTVNWLFGDC